MDDIKEIVQAFTCANLTPTIHIHDVHDNQIENYYAAAEPPQTKTKFGRLSLFVANETKLNSFISDLSVCESTADVCRAVVKLCDGRVMQKFKEKDFVTALLPHLNFRNNESALYQALNKIV